MKGRPAMPCSIGMDQSMDAGASPGGIVLAQAPFLSPFLTADCQDTPTLGTLTEFFLWPAAVL